jgi:carotenoid cleavage dioxygenase
MDACVHASMFASGHAGPDSPVTPFERLTIDPVARRVTRRVIDQEPQEFPRPDERLIGKPYRYAYCVALPADARDSFQSASRIFKHDVIAATREVRDFGEGRMPGEFVFVPSHADSGEDEGWLMGYVVDTTRNTTDLVILNARDFTGPAQATITIPHSIPPGFHGNFIPLA